MTATAAPYVPPQFFDNNGDPLDGGQLFVYSAGTSTKVATYTDAAASSQNTNPIVLDSSGRCTIFLIPGVSYKFVLTTSTDTDPPAAPLWTRDNVKAVPGTSGDLDVDGTAGETITAGRACYLSDGSGSLTAGQWYVCDNTVSYQSYTATCIGFALTAIAQGASGTFRIGGRVTGLEAYDGGTLTTLTVGAAYRLNGGAQQGLITKLSGSGLDRSIRLVGVADSTTSLIVSQWMLPAVVTQPEMLQFTIGIKGGSALSTGVHAYRYVPFNFYVTGWTLVADQSGSLVLDVWHDTYANAPPTVSDTIAGSEKPTLSTAQKNQDNTLTTWTVAIPPGVWGINVDSATTCVYATLTIEGYRVYSSA